MTKIRVFLFLLTLVFVGVFGVFVSYYARGYRPDFKALEKGTFRFQPNGILVIQSEPTGASVYIDGELKTATNANMSIAPGTYDVEVKKEGYYRWYKRLTIEKEVVTQATVSLFKNVPSLSPVTFSGAVNPVSALDGTKIAFSVLPSKDVGNDKIGLWEMDTFTLPLGFSNEPKRITDGDITGSVYEFSPDGRQVLLTMSNGIFLLDSGSFTSQAEMVNVASQKAAILSEWEKERNVKSQSQLRSLPQELADYLTRKSADFVFSPDGNMILYTASVSANLSDNLTSSLPGASTQKQERNLTEKRSYVYDIKEDRNFLITESPASLSNRQTPALRWMPSGKHILFADGAQVVIMDYDGTNRQLVYSGSYIAPFAFPYSNSTKILILTNLGAANTTPNLYTLTVK
ncbi:MAG TPA: PEGA domain-containing protein [Patescibacteria group bacterium]|nr:PEGA domain-containing protein [Patescibacteria group bacterium]